MIFIFFDRVQSSLMALWRMRWTALLLLGSAGSMAPVLAQDVMSRPFRVTVNSPLDGPITPDQALTLREAIALVNGSLSWAALSQAEQHLVVPAPRNTVVFNLPPTATTIYLQSELPAIAQAEATLDGTSQPGFQPGRPVVTLTPAPEVAIARGLTILGDHMTVKGLSLYGFAAHQERPEPSGDVLIMALRSSPQSGKEVGMVDADHAPERVVIEDNVLGSLPNGSRPTAPSDFGVVVLQAKAPIIRRNVIAQHNGSGLLTGERAEGMEIVDNRIEQNGFGAMADGIRLTGRVDGATLRNNIVLGNGGSAIYLFKSEGAVTLQGNTLQGNGTRLRQAAVYLMGSGHQVLNNRIQDQNGPGVVVAAYPQSDRIVIQNNRFAQIKGLSIDLVARQHTAVTNYLAGDGPNPTRDTGNRRRDTANGSVNAPEFLSSTFVRQGRQVNIDGKADPGTTVTLYRVMEAGDRGPLSEPVLTVQADAQGRFGVTLETLKTNAVISAIATDPQYGTSEPALNATIQGGDPDPVEIPMPQPRIFFNPTAVDPVKPMPLRVPHIVHFALDQDTLSPISADILRQVAQVLQQVPNIQVVLQGHTDERASVAYNQALALRRANRVKQFLVSQGIAASRITVRSLGESQLLKTGRDRLDHAHNRRVELLFQDANGIEIEVENQVQDLQIEGQ